MTNHTVQAQCRELVEHGAAASNALPGGMKEPSVARPWPQAICRSLLACGTAWTSEVEDKSLAPARGLLSMSNYLISDSLMSNEVHVQGLHSF
jgi:hypothetical protein